jgi:hypothetical protein
LDGQQVYPVEQFVDGRPAMGFGKTLFSSPKDKFRSIGSVSGPV